MSPTTRNLLFTLFLAEKWIQQSDGNCSKANERKVTLKLLHLGFCFKPNFFD
jgi:hypothetical protein